MIVKVKNLNKTTFKQLQLVKFIDQYQIILENAVYENIALLFEAYNKICIFQDNNIINITGEYIGQVSSILEYGNRLEILKKLYDNIYYKIATIKALINKYNLLDMQINDENIFCFFTLNDDMASYMTTLISAPNIAKMIVISVFIEKGLYNDNNIVNIRCMAE